MAKLVSKTYGDALFELAVESDRVDEFFEEAKGILSILESNEEFVKMMNHPQIVKEEKVEILENIFLDRISRETVGFMCMIVEKGHFKDMKKVFRYFIDRVKEYKKIGVVYVAAAMELTANQKQAIEKKILETTEYVELEMHYSVDTELIGGLVIRIKDRVVDSSIRTKLQRLTSDLSKIQLKAGECAS